jgi:hypothetical protein
LQDCNSILPFIRESYAKLENGKAILEKALYRQALAFYSLRRWNDAKEAYSELFRLFNDSKYNDNVAQVQQRIMEETTGKYDIAKLYKQADNSPFMDVADYYGSVEVVRMEDKGGGRGVCTTKDVEPGEILLANKAISYGATSINRMVESFNLELNMVESTPQVALRSNAIYKLCDQRELTRSVYSLYPGPSRKLDQVLLSKMYATLLTSNS